jgi:uncharacterized protein (TIGR00661 family)
MKRVLIAPLDWGLGHATRCIPIIREFINRQCEVMVAGSGDSLALLKTEFPSLRFFTIPGYNPVYQKNARSMVWKMAAQLPKFLNTIRQEHQAIETLVAQHQIHLIISDNRYGCWSATVPSIFITHQSNILMPKRFGWLAGIIRRKNESFINRFTECWLPDYPDDHTLAGELISFGRMKTKLRPVYIGPLSRFRFSGQKEKKYDVLVILSGPEPQRTILENTLLPSLQQSGLRYFVVRGVVTATTVTDLKGCNFLTSEALQEMIESSEVIVARSGFSTVMDMAALQKKVIFIPTPGQTEQEYLAQRLKEKKIAYFMKQQDFNLSIALREGGKYSGFPYFSSGTALLNQAISDTLHNIVKNRGENL